MNPGQFLILDLDNIKHGNGLGKPFKGQLIQGFCFDDLFDFASVFFD